MEIKIPEEFVEKLDTEFRADLSRDEINKFFKEIPNLRSVTIYSHRTPQENVKKLIEKDFELTPEFNWILREGWFDVSKEEIINEIPVRLIAFTEWFKRPDWLRKKEELEVLKKKLEKVI